MGRKVRLRPKRIQDAAADYLWRTDAELCHLDAAPLLEISFEEFLSDYIEQLRYQAPALRFAIETIDGKHIGNCSLFNPDNSKKEVELGIMIGDRAYWSQGYGTDSILTLLNYIFTSTNCQCVFLKTLDWNVRAHKCFEKCGFITTGTLTHNNHNFILMEFHRSMLTKKPQ